ncbi:MAG: putative tail tape measure protein [Prokaryotic dsDNA virus sp.]|nr:MAG: putative tail tape measure protein [Prokaryotic dsDNA virus sp.]|tara:strand:+ start:19099 stop:21291 length:2193 start_codon:yes stop_codon:yes gene_type:complete
MSVNLGSVFFELSAKNIQVDKAMRGLSKMHRSSERLQGSLGRLQKTLNVAGWVAIAAVGAKLSQTFLSISDRGTQLENRLRAVTNSTEEFVRAQEGLVAISRKTGTVLANNAQLYQRLAISADSLNASQEELLAITETVANLGRVSGSTAEDVKNSTRQLAQGLGSTFFRAEEFNSIIEQMPAVIESVAHEMGITASQLNMMVKEGELLSKDVFAALLKSQERSRIEASKLPLTLEESGNIVKNTILLGFTELNKELNTTTILGGVFQTTADLISASFESTATSSEKLQSGLDKGKDIAIRMAAAALVTRDVFGAAFEIIEQGLASMFKRVGDAIRAIADLPGMSALKAKLDADLPLLQELDTLEARFKRASKEAKDAKESYDKVFETGSDSEIAEELGKATKAYQRLDKARNDYQRFSSRSDVVSALSRRMMGGDNMFSGMFDAAGDKLLADFETYLEKMGKVAESQVKSTEQALANPGARKTSEGYDSVTGAKLGRKLEHKAADRIKLVNPILEEFNELIAGTDYEQMSKLNEELAKTENFIKNFGDLVSQDGLDALNEKVKALKEEMAELNGEEKRFKELFDKINSSIDTLSSDTGKHLVDKLFGDETSFKEVAKTFTKNLLSSILEEMILSPIANDIRNAFGNMLGQGQGASDSKPKGFLDVIGSAVGMFQPSGMGNIIGATAGMASSTVNNNQSATVVVNTPDAKSFQESRGRIESTAKNMLRTR